MSFLSCYRSGVFFLVTEVGFSLVTEVGLLSGQNRVADVRAETYCNLFSLSKDDFDHILECHPVMRKTIETIAAKRVHTLGKDPAMVSSRESLLEDITGIHQMMGVSVCCISSLLIEEPSHAFMVTAMLTNGVTLNSFSCINER